MSLLKSFLRLIQNKYVIILFVISNFSNNNVAVAMDERDIKIEEKSLSHRLNEGGIDNYSKILNEREIDNYSKSLSLINLEKLPKNLINIIRKINESQGTQTIIELDGKNDDSLYDLEFIINNVKQPKIDKLSLELKNFPNFSGTKIFVPMLRNLFPTHLKELNLSFYMLELYDQSLSLLIPVIERSSQLQSLEIKIDDGLYPQITDLQASYFIRKIVPKPSLRHIFLQLTPNCVTSCDFYAVDQKTSKTSQNRR